MVSRYAIVANGVVQNTIVATDQVRDELIARGRTVVALQPGFGNGDLYDGANFSKAPIDVEAVRKRLRAEAVRLMRACDWTQIPDSLQGPEKAAWLTYRASLRAVAKNPTVDITTVLPDPPGTFEEL